MIKLKRENGRLGITLLAIQMGEDLCVVIMGGKEHLGSVEVKVGTNKTENITIMGHKEYILNQKIGEILNRKYPGNFVICCGVHFDDITASEIKDVISLSCDMTEQLCEDLTKTF